MLAHLTIAAVLLLAPAAAPAHGGYAVFSVRNDTKAPIRCMLYEGGPVFQLVTIRPGREHVERVAPRVAAVSLACPKVRATVFGPLKVGTRWTFVAQRGRVELVEAAPR